MNAALLRALVAMAANAQAAFIEAHRLGLPELAADLREQQLAANALIRRVVQTQTQPQEIAS